MFHEGVAMIKSLVFIVFSVFVLADVSYADPGSDYRKNIKCISDLAGYFHRLGKHKSDLIEEGSINSPNKIKSEIIAAYLEPDQKWPLTLTILFKDSVHQFTVYPQENEKKDVNDFLKHSFSDSENKSHIAILVPFEASACTKTKPNSLLQTREEELKHQRDYQEEDECKFTMVSFDGFDLKNRNPVAATSIDLEIKRVGDFESGESARGANSGNNANRTTVKPIGSAAKTINLNPKARTFLQARVKQLTMEVIEDSKKMTPQKQIELKDYVEKVAASCDAPELKSYEGRQQPAGAAAAH